MIGLFVLVFLGATVTPGESAGVSNESILKRLEEMGKQMQQMGRQIQKMGQEIQSLKKENQELKAKVQKTDKEQAETKKALEAKKVVKAPVVKDTLIRNKPFKGGVKMEGEYLHLKAHRDASPYAGKIKKYQPAANPSKIQGKETDFDSHGAFRVGLAYAAPSGWDVGLKYSHFNTEGSSSLGTKSQDKDKVWANLLDRSLSDRNQLNGNFDSGIVDYAKQELELEYHIWDLELGNTFRPTEHTSVRLFGGLRYLSLENDSKVRYVNVEGLADTDEARIKNDLDVMAYGARLGSEFGWTIGSTGLSINLSAAASLLYANFETKRVDKYYNQSLNREMTRNVRNDLDSFLPIIDVDLALQYQYKWFFVRGGYTFSYWFNGDLKHQIGGWDDIDDRTSPHDYEKSDLSFHGWFIRAGIFF
jgi:hypothetical protein